MLATKWGNQKADMGYGPVAGAKGGRAYLKRAVTESLRRLRTDHIDLYQLHTPDPETPIDETIAGPGRADHRGQGPYGATPTSPAGSWPTPSTWPVSWAATVHFRAEPMVAAGPVGRGRGVPAARHFGLGVLPFYPLANGLLTGKVRRGQGVRKAPAWPSGPTTSPTRSWTGSKPDRVG